MRQEPLLSRRLDRVNPREPTFRPPPSSNRPLLLAVAALVLLFWVALSQGRLNFERGGADRATRSGREAAPLAPVQMPEASPPANDLSGVVPRSEQITKCISSIGAATYQDGACPAGTRAAVVTVRPGSNLADGMSPRARAASMQENRVIAQAQLEHEQRVAMNVSVDASAAECSQLAAAILALDDEARRPLPAREQDRIRAERRKARDRQFELRCQ